MYLFFLFILFCFVLFFLLLLLLIGYVVYDDDMCLYLFFFFFFFFLFQGQEYILFMISKYYAICKGPSWGIEQVHFDTVTRVWHWCTPNVTDDLVNMVASLAFNWHIFLWYLYCISVYVMLSVFRVIMACMFETS